MRTERSRMARRTLIVMALAFGILGVGDAAGAQTGSRLPPPPQRLEEVQPGTRIVLHLRGASSGLPGTLLGVDADTIRVTREALRDTMSILTSAVARAEVLHGLKDRTVGRSARRGFLIGAGLGAVFGLVVGSTDEKAADFFEGPHGMAAFMAVLGAIPGVVIGALSGLDREEVWVGVAVP